MVFFVLCVVVCSWLLLFLCLGRRLRMVGELELVMGFGVEAVRSRGLMT